MMYRIVYNETMDIYGPESELTVISPSLEVELNSAGTLTFTLPKDNIGWDYPTIFKDEIEVWEGDKIIWFGRPLEINRNWRNEKVVTCEGALAYFNDSIIRKKEINPSNRHTNIWFFRWLLDKHNQQVSENRKIFPGNVTVDEESVYRDMDYDTIAHCLQAMCLDTNGGYFILRKQYDTESGTYKRYMDWVKEMPYGVDQPVEFGLNMLDYSNDLNGADICTVLIPTGENDLTLRDLGDKDSDGVVHYSGSDEILFTEGINKYGRVIAQKSWNELSEVNELWRRAKKWLIEKNTDIPTIEVDAADLHYLSDYEDMGYFSIGTKVNVISDVHDIHQELMIYKLSMSLDSGVKKITIGTPPKRELTDIVKTGSGSTRTSGNSDTGGGSGGGGGGGTTDIPVKKVKVNGFDIVKDKEANVQIEAGENVSIDQDEQTGELTINALGKVQKVKVNGVNVVDDDTKTAKIEVEAGDNVSVSQSESGKLTISSTGAVSDVQVDNSSVVENKIAKISMPVTDVQVNGTSVMEGKVAKIFIDEQEPVVPKLFDEFWRVYDFDDSAPRDPYWILHPQHGETYPDYIVNIGSDCIKSFDPSTDNTFFKTEFTVVTGGYYIANLSRNMHNMTIADRISTSKSLFDIKMIHNGVEIDYMLDETINIHDENTGRPGSIMKAGVLEPGDKIIFNDVQPRFMDLKELDPQNIYEYVKDPYTQQLYVLKDISNLVDGQRTYYDYNLFNRSQDRIYDSSVHYFILINPHFLTSTMWAFRIADFDKVQTYFNVTKWLNDTFYDDNTNVNANFALPMINYYDGSSTPTEEYPRMDQTDSDIIHNGTYNIESEDVVKSNAWFGSSFHTRKTQFKIPSNYPNRAAYIAANGSNFIDGEYFDYLKSTYLSTGEFVYPSFDGLYLVIMVLANPNVDYDSLYLDNDTFPLRSGVEMKNVITISGTDRGLYNWELGEKVPYSNVNNLQNLITTSDKDVLVRIGNACNHKGTRQGISGHYFGVNSNNILVNQSFPNDSNKSKCALCDSIAIARVATAQQLRSLNDSLIGSGYMYAFAISLEYYFGDFVRQEELDRELDYGLNRLKNELETNFQAGVDSVYNACVRKGSTPHSHSLADVVYAVEHIETFKPVDISYIQSGSILTVAKAVSTTENGNDYSYTVTGQEVT